MASPATGGRDRLQSRKCWSPTCTTFSTYPLAALNILREAAGLEPLSSPDHGEPEDADGGMRSKGKTSND